MPESARSPFSYAILRVVPRVERGERFNAGVVAVLPAARLPRGEGRRSTNGGSRRSRPDARADEVRAHLEALVRVAAGDPEAGAIAELPPSERFGWLVAPSSTIIQPSEVHTGLTDDPARPSRPLFAELVEPVAPD